MLCLANSHVSKFRIHAHSEAPALRARRARSWREAPARGPEGPARASVARPLYLKLLTRHKTKLGTRQTIKPETRQTVKLATRQTKQPCITERKCTNALRCLPAFSALMIRLSWTTYQSESQGWGCECRTSELMNEGLKMNFLT